MLDLRELTFMDSTGLRALAQTNARADEAGFALSIIRGPRQIERVLEISGLADLLPLVDAPPADGRAAYGSLARVARAASSRTTPRTGRGVPSGFDEPGVEEAASCRSPPVVGAEPVVGVHALDAAAACTCWRG